jgi:hypothetical protein
MKQKDFVFLNVKLSLQVEEHPYTGRLRKLAEVYCATIIDFLKRGGLLKPAAAVNGIVFEDAVLRLSDLTDEGQDFIMSGATDNWLSACDRKSNLILAKGANEEERLKVYADPAGLKKRLEKFRKDRAARAH